MNNKLAYIKNYFNDHKKFTFWLIVIFFGVVSTLFDRLWWNLHSDVPSWDQADYLNSALDHGRALGLLEGGRWEGFRNLLDLSPKIPPLASLVNGIIMFIVGDSLPEASWSLSVWNWLLIFSLASWSLYLNGRKLGIITVFITCFLPFLFQLRTDYVLELPLISVCSFVAWRLSYWCDPKIGGKWIQAVIAFTSCALAILIKQSALLIVLPALFSCYLVGLRRNELFQRQFYLGIIFLIISVLPWFRHNWIMTIGGTYRSVIESAAIEGDPSIFNIKSFIWYFPGLPNQIGISTFIIGLSGCFLILLQNYRKIYLVNRDSDFLNKEHFPWIWLLFNLCLSWILTTLIPNKDPRYIACSIPLLILLLSQGHLHWANWVYFSFKRRLGNKIVYIFLAPFFINIFLFLNKFSLNTVTKERTSYVEEIISSVNNLEKKGSKKTIIVVPSTPELNQHNVSFYGSVNGGNILGRQLGNNKADIKPVLSNTNWIILAEGDQGSVSQNALLLDQSVRKSGLFDMHRKFTRSNGGNYSLWKRKTNKKIVPEFKDRFIKLANGMQYGPLGIKNIFDEIEIHHMIDGHFLYREKVMEESLDAISKNQNDINARWNLSLLYILANRPMKADYHLEKLELLLKDNPWPTAYRIIVNLAAWNPWRASRIAGISYHNNKNIVVKGLGDFSSVIGGYFWRIPSAINSFPKAILRIEELTNARI